MLIKVKYFASLKEKTGLPEEIINFDGESASDLYAFLKNKYHFPLLSDSLMVAINDEYVEMEEILNEGDLVVFIPPVAGG